MSLHYLVKLEMLIGHVLRWFVTGRNSRIYSASTVDLKFARIESNWLQRVGVLYKIRITDLNELKQPLRMEWAKQLFVGGVVDSPRSVMRILYTVSCNISHMLLSTAFKFGEFGFGMPQLRWDKFWRFFL